MTDNKMDSLSINVFDMVALAVLLLSAVLAFFRGFVHEVLSITAWVGAALSALYGFPYARPKAHELIPIPMVADVAAAVAVFLVVLLILSMVTRTISKQVQGSALNSVDRSLGFLFGLVRGAVVLSIAYVVLSWVIPDPAARPDWMRYAKSGPLLESGANLLRSMVPPSLLSEEERARMATVEAQERARQAVELKQTYDRLTQPRVENLSRPDATQTAPATVGGSATITSTPPANSVPALTVQGQGAAAAPVAPATPASPASPATSSAARPVPATTNGASSSQKNGSSYDANARQSLDSLIQNQQ
ncbi:hypothetical protein GCM10027396_39980 [Insolitispirillum peregrinum]